MIRKRGKIIIPEGVHVWPHELRVARILANAGHVVEFLLTRSIKTADVLVDGVEYEIKSPRSGVTNSLEHLLKKALRQSPNLIIDTARMKGVPDGKVKQFLVSQAKARKQIKKMVMITKHGQIIDILGLI